VVERGEWTLEDALPAERQMRLFGLAAVDAVRH